LAKQHYSQFSHPGLLGIASRVSLGTEGQIYAGGNFDPEKVDAYWVETFLVLLDREAFDANTLARAIAATFILRGMPVSAVLPTGLTDEFATYLSRQAMWHTFVKKNVITITPLSDVVAKLRAMLEPALVQAATFSDASRLVEIDKQDAS
jgi:hypothetical protein